MKTLKYSRQREAIKGFLSTRKDHPSADTVYAKVRKEYPNISLGTVYRNLALLESLGEIMKITTGLGTERYDGNPSPHNHFVCNNCQCVIDLEMESIDSIKKVAAKNFDGTIEGYTTIFNGLCSDCTK